MGLQNKAPSRWVNREVQVLEEEIEMRQVKTDEQIADLFTKSLSVGKFEHFRRQLGVIQRMGANIEGEC